MNFFMDGDGKKIFLSVDSRQIAHNPLYKAFKAKTFTDRDIMLHFYILDILADGEELSSGEIMDRITSEYLSVFDNARELDESTIRKKLNEYVSLGLLWTKKDGRKKLYTLSVDEVNLSSCKEAAAFFSEADPMGVIGSYILDKLDMVPDVFRFKHHYIMTAVESEVLYELLEVINAGAKCEIEMFSSRQNRLKKYSVMPMKIYVSTHNGRRYLMAWRFKFKEIAFYRLDKIKSVKCQETVDTAGKYRTYAAEQEKFLWGVSVSDPHHTGILEMTLRIEEGSEYIVDRLMREKRGGKVERLDSRNWKFTAEVYDPTEMVPWIRTFIGRIVSVKCSDKNIEETIKADLKAMYKIYGIGGEEDDIQ